MQLRKIEISNFRGIKKMNWIIPSSLSNLVCLIGNGDSGKTTILDAINLAFLPLWNYNVKYTDFYNCDDSNEIAINVTITDLPDCLLSDDKYGLYIRKNIDLGDLNDEPIDDDEVCLTISLKIDKDYNPEWKVINNRSDGKIINYKDRSKLLVSRIGEEFSKDFTIGRNSIIKSYLPLKNDIDSQLLDILKLIQRTDINNDDKIKECLTNMQKVLTDYNLPYDKDLSLVFEISTNDITTSNVNLCGKKIPLSRSGTGTKRLISSSLNLGITDLKSTILIDEIEYGLEPYRLADFLNKLKDKKLQGTVMMTTHSMIPITELDYNNLFICLNNYGMVECKSIDEELQGLLRSIPQAFLSKKILLCEGSTEYKMLKVFDKHWNQTEKSMSYFSTMVVAVNGGSGAIDKAKKLFKLGYEVGIFIDGDVEIVNKQVTELKNMGISIFRWEDSYNTEKIILEDLGKENYYKIVKYLKELNEDTLKQQLNEKFGMLEYDIDLISQHYNNEEILERFEKIMGKFKKDSYGIYLGNLCLENIETMPKMKTMINLIKNWYRNNE